MPRLGKGPRWTAGLALLVAGQGVLGVGFGGCRRPNPHAGRERARRPSVVRQSPEELHRQLGRARAELLRAKTQLTRLKAAERRRAQVHELLAEAQVVRGLEARCALDARWVGKGFVRRFVRRSLDADYPPDFLAGYLATYAGLGLLPAGYKLKAELVNLMEEQAAGLYDPKTKRLYVGTGAVAQEIVLVHEIVHALQDQHFDLRRLVSKPWTHTEDYVLAVHGLVEGDATVAMNAYAKHIARKKGGAKVLGLLGEVVKALFVDQSKLSAAPAYVRQSLIGSYLNGQVFVEELIERGGWAAVNKAFQRPPVSTEQLLHIDKYLSDERPMVLRLPDAALRGALGEGWRQVHDNTVGEFGVQVMVEEAGVEEAGQVAKGWGGDRVRAYRDRAGRVLVAWKTRWDTTADAEQFARALPMVLDKRHTRIDSAKSAGDTWRWRAASASAASGSAALAARGRDVTLVDGPVEPALARRLARLLLR